MNKIFLRTISLCITLVLLFSLCGCIKQNIQNVLIGGVEYSYSAYSDSFQVVNITLSAGKRVKIPETLMGKPVTGIRMSYRLFKLPNAVEELILPESITDIDRNVYEDCAKLVYNEYENGLYLGTESNPYFAFIKPKYVELVEEMSYKIDSGIDAPDKRTPPTPPYEPDGSDITECTIHPDTKVMAENAFAGCQYIKNIIVPGGIENIPGYAFAGCTSLETVVLEEGVKTMTAQYGIFEGCCALKEISFPDTLELGNYLDGMFATCESLKSVRLPASLGRIPEEMFAGCVSLEYIEIPDSVTLIDSGAFAGCTSLSEMKISKNVTEIREGAFYGCSSLESFEVDAENQNFSSVNGELRSKDGTVLVVYPAGKKDEVYIAPDELVSIGSCAFGGSGYLKSVILHDKVANVVGVGVSTDLFSGCTSLETVILGKGISHIDSDMFSGCVSLKEIYISETANWIQEWGFHECPSLEKITVNGNNKKYYSVDGVLFDKNNTLLRYPAAKSDENYTVPQGTVCIGESAFEKVKYLKQIEFPSSLDKIGNSAFFGCASLVSVMIPDTVTALGRSVFDDCTALERVTVGNGVTEIPSSAFSGCSSLKEITLGKCTQSIGWGAFNGTLALEKLFIPKTVKTIDKTLVDGLNTEYYFEGTKAEWLAICEQTKGLNSDYLFCDYIIHCSDGDLEFKRER